VTEEAVSFAYQPRSAYAGYRVFSSDDGAVLVEPEVARGLRHAAESANQEQRVTGGLLFGGRWVDDEGVYLVVLGFLAAGAGEDSAAQLGGTEDFALSEADLRRLRQEAASVYPECLEVGWWRTRAALGEFSAGDFATQAELVDRYSVGLLVYGSGVHWGTAYLGPDGHAPDVAGTLVAPPGADSEPPPDDGLARPAETAADPEPELVDIAAGESLLQEPLPTVDPVSGTPVRRRTRPPRGLTRPRMPSRVRVPPRVQKWAADKASEDRPGHQTPAETQLVLGALALVAVAIAIIIGVLAGSLLVALILAAVGLLAVFWFSRASRR
jgi:hypothetical protein